MLADVRRGPPSAPASRVVSLATLTWRGVCFRHSEAEYAFGVPSMLFFSFLVGVIGTAYGIGGGSFMVPICLAIYRLPVHAIAGATLTATFLTSGIALAAYAWLPAPAGVTARPDWALGLSFGLGGLAGTYLARACRNGCPRAGSRACLVWCCRAWPWATPGRDKVRRERGSRLARLDNLTFTSYK
jgi:uncharacterized membrane protein YfcA